MAVEIINWMITLVIAGAIGWAIAARRPGRTGPVPFVILVILAIVGLGLGKNTILVGVADIKVFLNRAVFSGCVGGCVGLLVNNYRVRGSRNA